MKVTESDLNYLRSISRHINEHGNGDAVLAGNVTWLERFITRLGAAGTIPEDAYDAYWQGHRDGQACSIASNEDLKKAIRVLTAEIQAFHAKAR